MKRAALIAALAAVMMLGAVASAHAADATGTTVITASVNSKLVLTVPGDHDFGGVAFDPDAADPAPYVSAVNVRSNVPFTLGRTDTNGFPTGMLSVPLAVGMDGTTSQAKAPSAAGRDYGQTFTLDLTPGGDWADAGSYTATYLYTATY